MKKSQMARIVKFDREVSGKLYPNCTKFSLKYGVCRRTVARDVEYLRDRLCAPLEYDVERQGYYYSSPWSLPGVVVRSAEVEDPVGYLVRELRRLSDTQRERVLAAVQKRPESPSLQEGTQMALVA